MPITYALTEFPDDRPDDRLGSPAHAVVRVRRLAAAVAFAVALVLALAAPVNAGAAATGDGNGNGSAVRVGNGSDNRNMVTMGSTHLVGALHQVSTGVGGVSSVQGGLCRPHTRVCALSQHIQARSVATSARRSAGPVRRPRTAGW